ncbi:unnamed protein product [Dicrocoelium dendriticum]|nr:unnamed protein product [Dicrocoelium dendriticum]
MLQAVSKALLTLDSFLATTHGDPAAGFYFEWPNVTFQTVQRRLMELRRSTKQWYDVLSDTDPAHVSQLSELAFIELVAAAAHPLSPSSTSVTPASGTPSTQPTRKLSIRGLRQHIRAIAAASPGHLGSPRGRHLTHWDRKRVAFINWLQSELTALIPSPMNLPLHEVFYGPRNPINRSTKLPSHPNILSVRRRLNPPYQQCLHQALSDPGNYLQISEYQLDSPDSLSSCLPDLSILYKLHLGSTKSINLYDWLVAFASVLGEDVFENSLPSKTTQYVFLLDSIRLIRLLVPWSFPPFLCIT